MDSTRGFALKTWNRIWAYFEGPGPGRDPCFDPKYVERVRCMGMCTDPGFGVWAHIRYRPISRIWACTGLGAWALHGDLAYVRAWALDPGYGLPLDLGCIRATGLGLYIRVYRPMYGYTGLYPGFAYIPWIQGYGPVPVCIPVYTPCIQACIRVCAYTVCRPRPWICTYPGSRGATLDMGPEPVWPGLGLYIVKYPVRALWI